MADNVVDTLAGHCGLAGPRDTMKPTQKTESIVASIG